MDQKVGVCLGSAAAAASGSETVKSAKIAEHKTVLCIKAFFKKAFVSMSEINNFLSCQQNSSIEMN